MTKSWNDLEAISETSNYEEYNNLMLIDANNLSYRYIQRKNYNSYTEDFKRTVQSLAKSYKAKRVIVCFDYGKSVYRSEILPEYKGTRKKPETEEEISHFEEFFAVLNQLPDELDEEVLKFRGIEADDLIAYGVMNLSERYEHTWIISSDRDLLQLLDDNVSIFNMFSRKEITKDSLFEETGLTPEEYMMSRIIEGDKGDNIIGIEGIGPKRAQGLVKEYKTLDNLLSKLPIKGKSKYITNLNAGADTLRINKKLIALKENNLIAIEAANDSESILSELSAL